MFRSRTQGIFQAFQACLIVFSVALFWWGLGVFVTYYHPPGYFDFDHYAVCCGLMVVALFYSGIQSDLNENNFLQPSFYESHQAAVKAVIRMTLFWLVYNFSIHNDTISRVFLFSFICLLYVVLLLLYRFLPPLLSDISFRGLREQRAILVGSRPRAESLTAWIHRKQKLGLNVVGWIPNQREVYPVEGLAVLGSLEELERIVTDQQVGLVILLDLFLFSEELSPISAFCESLGVRLLIVNDIEERIGQSTVFIQDDDVKFVAMRTEPLENPFNRILKRLLDLVIASIAILLVLPIPTLIVAICQFWQSRGPLLYKQKRAGFQNEVFRIFKFRTMTVNHGDDSRQASAHDVRVYPAGQIFRRFSVDELPQFWNVLRGEMSVVGPRPHMTEHNDSFSRLMNNYHVRTYVKPGITGLAQVRGFRGETKTDQDLQARIESDIHYIENWSLAMDVMIILRTIVQVFLPPRTAY